MSLTIYCHFKDLHVRTLAGNSFTLATSGNRDEAEITFMPSGIMDDHQLLIDSLTDLVEKLTVARDELAATIETPEKGATSGK